ncbi:MAG: tyrosine-type recombinase/integrase [bacterium]
MVRKAKKRSHGTGSIIKRGDCWLLRISAGGKIVQRSIKDPYTGLRARTKSEAEKLASPMIADILSGGKLGLYQTKPATVSLAELNEAYMEAFAGLWRDSKRRTNWIHYIGEAMRSFKTVADITHEGLGKHVQKRLATPTWRGNPRSPANVNRELAALKRLLNWALFSGRIEKNPMTGFPMLKEPHSRERILSPAEIARLLEALKQPAYSHIRLIVLIAMATGMRRSEILNLKWAGSRTAKTDNAVNLEEGVFDLQRTKHGKRKVPIPAILKAELAALPRVSDYVFPSPVDTTKPISEIKKSFASLMREARIEACRFHDLRHVAASGWVGNGVDIRTVQELLGHASITTTQRYLTSLAESKRKAVEELSNHIFNSRD